MRDGSRQFTRRGALLAGAAVVVGAAAAVYAPLAVGDEFEELVADRLGADGATVRPMLDGMRERLGGAEYDLRAAAFAVAVRRPVSVAIPGRLRREALDGFLVPMFALPANVTAYGLRRLGAPSGCAGVVREL